MKFRYAKYGPVSRPIVPVKLKHGSTEIGYHVLVDSGSDLCFFDSEIGEALGINVKNGKPREIFGVGGKASIYYLCEVEIIVGGWSYKIEAGFMPNVAGRTIPYGLVGQEGFFDKFVVKFNLIKEEIEIKLHGKQ